MEREVYKYTHHSGEFGETAYPIRRARMTFADYREYHFVEVLWRVEYFNPNEDYTQFEWEVI